MNETGNLNKPVLREIAAKNLLSFGPEGLRLELKPLNVLIGPNGSGKSNLFEVLGLLKAAPTEIAKPIREGGGIRNWLWRREPVHTATVEVAVDFPDRDQHTKHRLEITESNQRTTRIFEDISLPGRTPESKARGLSNEFPESSSNLPTHGEDEETASLHGDGVPGEESILSILRPTAQFIELGHLREVYLSISLYRDWQFGRSNILRGAQNTDVRQNRLEPDLSNLGMFLNRLRQDPGTKAKLIEKLSDAYEGLTDFELNFQGGSVEVYFAEGDLAVPASRLSDGSLRYLCLLALLLDPEPPLLIGIEEPELGLHPDLIPKIADLLVDASSRCQLVVTTHSDVLVDALSEHPDSVVVCEKHDGHTTMNRLDSSDLAHWLESYRLGQLWTSGELGGVRW